MVNRAVEQEGGPMTLRQNGSGEIRSLTGLRGVAALFVVVFHYQSMSAGWENSPVLGRPSLRAFIDHGYVDRIRS